MPAPKHSDRALAAARLEPLVKVFERQGMQDVSLGEVSARAAEFPDVDTMIKMLSLSNDQLKELGWDRTQLHVCIDAKKPKSQVPFYLQAAHERSLARMKTLPTGEGGGGSAGAVYIPATARPVDDDEEEDDEEPSP